MTDSFQPEAGIEIDRRRLIPIAPTSPSRTHHSRSQVRSARTVQQQP